MDKPDSHVDQSTTQETGKAEPLSPWSRQKRTPQDSHLVSFGERVTYTFAIGQDVASIHYDQGRGKLFYKGHRITLENIEPWVVTLLQHFKTILAQSEYSERFLEGYSRLLEKMMRKKTARKPSRRK